MRIAICEDNRTEAQSLLLKIVQSTEFIGEITESIEIFPNGTELLNTEYKYELAFIDCRLPDMTGPELAKNLRKKNIEADIVFVTAYNEYAVEGYECGALRYLMKPISDRKLTEALSAYIKKQHTDGRIDIKTTGKPVAVKQSDIMYIEAVENKTIVRLDNADLNSRISLAEFERMLHYTTFFRTSRQFIVNMKYVQNLDKNSITMENGEYVKISRRNVNEFKKRYKQYLTNNYRPEDDDE